MTLDRFRQSLTTQPVRPFQILLVDGRGFMIVHTVVAAMDPRWREVTFYEQNGTQHFIDTILIAEVIVPPTQEPSAARWPNREHARLLGPSYLAPRELSKHSGGHRPSLGGGDDPRAIFSVILRTLKTNRSRSSRLLLRGYCRLGPAPRGP